MGEEVDAWAAEHKKNLFGQVRRGGYLASPWRFACIATNHHHSLCTMHSPCKWWKCKVKLVQVCCGGGCSFLAWRFAFIAANQHYSLYTMHSRCLAWRVELGCPGHNLYRIARIVALHSEYVQDRRRTIADRHSRGVSCTCGTGSIDLR